MEEYSYSKNEDVEDLDIPLVRKAKKKTPLRLIFKFNRDK